MSFGWDGLNFIDGAIVEDDVMIGAGSLVPQNKRLESGYLYLGSPVKQIRPLSDEERRLGYAIPRIIT